MFQIVKNFFIEKNVPITPDGRGRPLKPKIKKRKMKKTYVPKYPFNKMDVNDCFIVQKSENIETARIKILDAAAKYRKLVNKDFKITTRKLEDGTLRVWRIA